MSLLDLISRRSEEILADASASASAPKGCAPLPGYEASGTEAVDERLFEGTEAH